MIRERIDVVIAEGKTTFVKITEELPLFARTGDLTETLGQYAGTIGSGQKKEKLPSAPKPQDSVLYSPDGIMY